MIKFVLDSNFIDEELKKSIKENLRRATTATVNELYDKGKEIAANRLRSGYSHWERNFKLEKVPGADDEWLMYVGGKLGKMMEEGFGKGAIKELLLNGKVYQENKSKGKNYVDIPIFNVNEAVRRMKTPVISISKVKDGDEIIKRLQEDRRTTKRITTMIKMAKSNRTKGAALLHIRRITPDTKGWPNTPFPGAKVLEVLESFIDRTFGHNIERVFR